MSARSRSRPWFGTKGERYDLACREADRRTWAQLKEQGCVGVTVTWCWDGKRVWPLPDRLDEVIP